MSGVSDEVEEVELARNVHARRDADPTDHMHIPTTSQQLTSVHCLFCRKHATRILGAADPALYCSREWGRAAQKDRQAQRRGEPLPSARELSAACWRRAIGERSRTGRIVHARSRCAATGKVSYTTPIEAWVTAFVDFKDARGLQAYRCEHCGGCHLGHAKRRWDLTQVERARDAFDKARKQMMPTIREWRAANPGRSRHDL